MSDYEKIIKFLDYADVISSITDAVEDPAIRERLYELHTDRDKYILNCGGMVASTIATYVNARVYEIYHIGNTACIKQKGKQLSYKNPIAGERGVLSSEEIDEILKGAAETERRAILAFLEASSYAPIKYNTSKSNRKVHIDGGYLHTAVCLERDNCTYTVGAKISLVDTIMSDFDYKKITLLPHKG